jgi:hypothetical protein
MRMMAGWTLAAVCLALAGCASAPVEVVSTDAPEPVLEEPQKPAVLFPDYLLMDRFKLNDHGIIPDTGLIGADMTVAENLATVRSLISGQLAAHQWNTDKMEIGRQYFRLLASQAGEEIEIRAVQGTGPTQVFLLYRPATARNTQ